MADTGPAVPITDKDERKKVRRSKAEKKLNVVESNNDSDSMDQSSSKSKVRTGASQMSESILHLDRRKYTGLQDITSIRVATDEAEAKRRVQVIL